jgi:hypothetical protein
MEVRLKKVFPVSAARSDEKARHSREVTDMGPTLTPQQAQEVFDEAVRLARSNAAEADQGPHLSLERDTAVCATWS